jgi:hypothetical protein
VSAGTGSDAEGAGAFTDGAGKVTAADGAGTEAAGAGTVSAAGAALPPPRPVSALGEGRSGSDTVWSVADEAARPRLGADDESWVAAGLREATREAGAESDWDAPADAPPRDEVSAPSLSAAATALPFRIATPTPRAAAIPPTRPTNCPALMPSFLLAVALV